jgi:ERCC4-related helicase
MRLYAVLILTQTSSILGFHQTSSVATPRDLIGLCAIFNCLTITTVMKKENEEELERCVHRVSEDEIIYVEKQKSFDLLRLSIEKELKDLILQLFLNKETNPLQIFPEKDFDMNGYEQNLELLKQTEQKNQNFSFVLLINYILPIYRHLKSLIDLTPELVLEDLKDDFQMTYDKREHPMDIDTLIYDKCRSLLKKKLTELEDSQQTLSNPKLDKLVELLKKHAEKPNSRGNRIVAVFKRKISHNFSALILVERTFYAKKICEFLQNHPELKVS